ncbi:hypothetical protein [Leclercia sp.]|uniref:hypothetical protein n=1 Tax=Leclercia sp. TaxID=1898428 RepID=UPI0028BDEEBB|nr:hypothetical protein [Leclercia sp.]
MQQTVFVKSIVFGEIVNKDDVRTLTAEIEWTDDFKKHKSVWCGDPSVEGAKAERIARERIWAFANTMCEPERLDDR